MTGPARVSPGDASTYVISITPFTEDGSFDEAATRAHLRRMAAGGVGVYLGGGGSGEGYVLTRPETLRLLEIGVEEAAGKVPVRAMGVEPRSAEEMVEFVDAVSRTGVEAVQIYSLDPGHGHRPTMAEVERYLEEVLARTSVPAVISSHQSVGYKIPVPLLVSLAERFDHLVGVNCSHQDLGYLADLVDGLQGRAEVHVGGPNQALTALALGATGFLSSEANLAPHLCSGVITACREADPAVRALDLFGRLVRLSGTLYGAGGIRATKAVLGSLGLPGGYPRPPQLPVSGAALAAVREAVDVLDLAGIEGWDRPG